MSKMIRILNSYEFYKSLRLDSLGGEGTNDTVLNAVDDLLENPDRQTDIHMHIYAYITGWQQGRQAYNKLEKREKKRQTDRQTD